MARRDNRQITVLMPAGARGKLAELAAQADRSLSAHARRIILQEVAKDVCDKDDGGIDPDAPDAVSAVSPRRA